MSSMFLGLNTAYKGLLASNAALNTTANNISNAETPGFSRQQVVQTAAEAIRSFTTYGCVGAGVDVIAIERIRDNFYDTKYWENNQKLGNFETKSYYSAQIEAYFSDDEEVKGFNTYFNNMYNALDEVLKNPGDSSTRSQFLNYAESFTEYFNNMHQQLQGMQEDANEEIKIKVDKISSISEQLGILNQQINILEVSGGTANELRDQREYLIDQLSEIVQVTVRETPIYDQSGQKTNATRYDVSICGGLKLVENETSHTLSCRARTEKEKVNQSDIEGLYEIYWDDTGDEFSLSNSSIGGSLKGLIDIRDGNNSEFFNGKVSDVYKTMYTDEQGETTQRTAIKVEVSAEYLTDFKKTTLSDRSIITAANKDFYYDAFEYVQETAQDGSTKYFYVFTLAEGEAANRSICNQSAGIGENVSYQGVPYYMAQMNEWCRNYAEVFNNILTDRGIDGYGNAATNLFLANSVTGMEQYSFEEYEKKLKEYQEKVQNNEEATLTISNKTDSYYMLTSGTFAISDYISYDAQRFATHTDAYDKDSDDANDIIVKLQDLKTNRDRMSFRGCSANEFLQCILSDAALNANTADTFTKSCTSLQNVIGNQRLTISGVDTDEEAVNLVKYQTAYNLSSKMVQVLTEVYDRLILETGV